MSARLMAQLSARGIRVRRVGDQLGVTFPDGMQPPGAVAFLREHKAELLATLTPPTFPTWPPAAVESAVSARAGVLRGWGYAIVHAERQAAEEVLGAGDHVHPSARCALHGCSERRLPRSELYRCPACVPGQFADRGRL